MFITPLQLFIFDIGFSFDLKIVLILVFILWFVIVNWFSKIFFKFGTLFTFIFFINNLKLIFVSWLYLRLHIFPKVCINFFPLITLVYLNFRMRIIQITNHVTIKLRKLSFLGHVLDILHVNIFNIKDMLNKTHCFIYDIIRPFICMISFKNFNLFYLTFVLSINFIKPFLWNQLIFISYNSEHWGFNLVHKLTWVQVTQENTGSFFNFLFQQSNH